jgi:hypothetical protein
LHDLIRTTVLAREIGEVEERLGESGKYAKIYLKHVDRRQESILKALNRLSVRLVNFEADLSRCCVAIVCGELCFGRLNLVSRCDFMACSIQENIQVP